VTNILADRDVLMALRGVLPVSFSEEDVPCKGTLYTEATPSGQYMPRLLLVDGDSNENSHAAIFAGQAQNPDPLSP
jgi:hypothetical protein